MQGKDAATYASQPHLPSTPTRGGESNRFSGLFSSSLGSQLQPSLTAQPTVQQGVNLPQHPTATPAGLAQAAQKMAAMLKRSAGLPPTPGLTANMPPPPGPPVPTDPAAQGPTSGAMPPAVSLPGVPPVAPPDPMMAGGDLAAMAGAPAGPPPMTPPMMDAPPAPLPANPRPVQQSPKDSSQALGEAIALHALESGQQAIAPQGGQAPGHTTGELHADNMALGKIAFDEGGEDAPAGPGTKMRGWQWKALLKSQDQASSDWLPRLFRNDSTPLVELLASPGKQGLLGAALGAGIGAVGGHYVNKAVPTGLSDLGNAGVGAGVGGLLGGVGAYAHRRKSNDEVLDALRRTPPGATVFDYKQLQEDDAKNRTLAATKTAAEIRNLLASLRDRKEKPETQQREVRKAASEIKTAGIPGLSWLINAGSKALGGASRIAAPVARAAAPIAKTTAKVAPHVTTAGNAAYGAAKGYELGQEHGGVAGGLGGAVGGGLIGAATGSRSLARGLNKVTGSTANPLIGAARGGFTGGSTGYLGDLAARQLGFEGTHFEELGAGIGGAGGGLQGAGRTLRNWGVAPQLGKRLSQLGGGLEDSTRLGWQTAKNIYNKAPLNTGLPSGGLGRLGLAAGVSGGGLVGGRMALDSAANRMTDRSIARTVNQLNDPNVQQPINQALYERYVAPQVQAATQQVQDSIDPLVDQAAGRISGHADQYMKSRGLSGDDGRFSPMNAIGSQMKGFGSQAMGMVDKLFESIHPSLAQLSTPQKLMILAGVLGIGGGVATGSPFTTMLGALSAGGGAFLPQLQQGAQHAQDWTNRQLAY